MNPWLYFVLGVITYQILKMLYLIARKEWNRRQEKLFLKSVRVTFPDAEDVMLTAIETSDKKAMQDLQRQLGLVQALEKEDDEYEMEPFPERP